MIRTQEFRDKNNNGTDDRDEDKPRMAGDKLEESTPEANAAREALSQSERNKQIRNEIASDPERTAQRVSGVDRSKYDFEGYSDSDIAKAMQGDSFGEKDYARLTGKSSGGNDSESDGDSDSSGNTGVSTGGETANKPSVASGRPDPNTFAQQAINAAKKNNPVDFKALDQRIHDRPLYMQAKADIKHSETFGDTWSWDNAPDWNLDRFKSSPMENRYQDVMDKDDDD